MDNPVGFIDSVKWKFASSMPHIPHWYIVKEKVDPYFFEQLVQHIREYGRLGIWGAGKLHWYWHPRDHDYYYWTMGWPIEETTVINRAKKEGDNVRYLDVQIQRSIDDRQVIDKWCDWTECPFCLSHDPFAQQWSGNFLVALFCSSCRRRFL